ncbi:hypothetical protein P9294_gp002 [Bacillus phage FADO]|uniref:Uncharacterized protein n=1 Tax=Bacillus phage FADO TaxID=2917160 RepID=A0AAE9GAC8_9CAUD|nr:hypothetical protein P9294_gp002 [Bacillus phage FADO]UNY48717.1 hypothetical protein fado_2 [Bacillus phage FADO]
MNDIALGLSIVSFLTVYISVSYFKIRIRELTIVTGEIITRLEKDIELRDDYIKELELRVGYNNLPCKKEDFPR